MAQKKNIHQNNSFVNQTRLPLLCEKSGAILLALLRQAGWQAARQSDEILVDLKNLNSLQIAFSQSLTKVQC